MNQSTCSDTTARQVLMGAAAVTAALALSPAAMAQSWFDAVMDFDFSYGGFVRSESALRNTNMENPNNQPGNKANDVTADRQAFVPPNLTPSLPGGLDDLIPVAQEWGDTPIPGFEDEPVRRGDFIDGTLRNNFNWLVGRFEGEASLRWGRSFRLVGRVRALYDPLVYEAFNEADIFNDGTGPDWNGIQPGPFAAPQLYRGNPNYFDYLVQDGAGGFENPNPLEWTSDDYQIYLPSLVAEYNRGGLSIRVGNQQIAWGQSIFFRVFDVPNGLDLRRHLILDRALEEFSDKRVPMLSARVTYQLTDNILFDGYVGKFQPTIFGNPNTPYNVIPVQFTVQDSFVSGGYDDELVGGFRLKGDYGRWGWQAAYVRRYAPEGVFRWTETGVVADLQGDLGEMVNSAYNAKQPIGSPACPDEASYDPATCRRYDSTGEALANAPFHAGPGGVYSAEEWFQYAADVRLDGILGLNAAIDEFDGSRDVYASAVPNFEQADAQLNTFFIGSGESLRGHILREYFEEDVFALGATYVNDSKNDFLNQLIFNLEAQYTPERTYTNINLSGNYIKESEYTVSLVIDKWHRFFKSFPGTFIVAQALTKSTSDLVGRHLSGYNGLTREQLQQRAADGIVDTRSTLGKDDNATYFVLGFLQPWPNKLYELEFAMLYDPDGGVFAQPGMRWNPGKGITVEGFYNYVNGELSGNPNGNLVSTLDFAEEFTLRMSYQF